MIYDILKENKKCGEKMGKLLTRLQEEERRENRSFLTSFTTNEANDEEISILLSRNDKVLLSEDIDSTSVISILNEQMTDSDLKIILYEINNRLYGGENLEEILEDFEYFDDLFISFFQMYMKNPQQRHSLSYYIQVTYEYLDYCIERFLKYLIPMIYGFVAMFVITIYIAIIIPMMNSISNI